MELSEKLILLRNQRGLTQEALAETSGLNIRTIQRIESGETRPRGATLKLLCQSLDVEPSSIVSEKIMPSKTSLITKKVMELLMLVCVNLILTGIIGFLTLDSGANLNSRLASLPLSFFLSASIVFLTPGLRAETRLTRFGSGYGFYLLLTLIIHGFPVSWITCLFPSLIIATLTLYYGNRLIEKLPFHTSAYKH
jgi:transcriptional regulator with XRE-family HTH domain